MGAKNGERNGAYLMADSRDPQFGQNYIGQNLGNGPRIPPPASQLPVQTGGTPSEEGFLKKHKDQIIGLITTLISSILTAVAMCAFMLPHMIGDLSNDIASIKTDVKEINHTLTDVRVSQAADETVLDFVVKYLDKSAADPFHQAYSSANAAVSPEFQNFLVTEFSQRNKMSAEALAISCESVLTTEGQSFSTEQLEDFPLLLSYSEDDKRGLFYGQYDEHHRWQGRCIINLYDTNDELWLITEAYYNSGELIFFQQVFPDTSSHDKTDIWVVSKRIMDENGVSHGTTWHYFREEEDDFSLNFDIENAKADNILSAEDFLDKKTGAVEGVYCGDISDGFFNDESGTACMVKFFKNGTVRTLYVGNFQKGKFHDETGDAWMIGKSDSEEMENNVYSIYHGEFSSGLSKHPYAPDDPHWEPIDQAQIDEITSGLHLPVDLLWTVPPA